MIMKKQILILSSAEEVETRHINDEFVAELQHSLGEAISIEWHNYHDVRVWFGSGGTRVMLQDGRMLQDFAYVYFKSFFRYSELASVIAHYLQQNNVPFVCSELLQHGITTKLSQLSYLGKNSLPIPDTLFMLRSQWLSAFDECVEHLGLPFIFKSIDGSTGEENYLVKSLAEFKAALDTHAHEPLEFIAQRFVPNDSDLRVLIVGSEIKLIIKRQRNNPDETHLNNTSQGAHASLLPLDTLSPELQQLCLTAANVLHREIAGVDLLFSRTDNSPYILEVNASPQIGSGAFMEEKLAIYTDYFKDIAGVL